MIANQYIASLWTDAESLKTSWLLELLKLRVEITQGDKLMGLIAIPLTFCFYEHQLPGKSYFH